MLAEAGIAPGPVDLDTLPARQHQNERTLLPMCERVSGCTLCRLALYHVR